MRLLRRRLTRMCLMRMRPALVANFVIRVPKTKTIIFIPTSIPNFIPITVSMHIMQELKEKTLALKKSYIYNTITLLYAVFPSNLFIRFSRFLERERDLYLNLISNIICENFESDKHRTIC